MKDHRTCHRDWGVCLVCVALVGIAVVGCRIAEDETDAPTIDLLPLVPWKSSDSLATGPLVREKDFARVLKSSELLEVYRGRAVLVNAETEGLARTDLFKLPEGSWSLKCAVKAPKTLLVVEENAAGEFIKLVPAGGAPPRTVFSVPRPKRGGDIRHIHSLSLSSSGRRVAFMVSESNRWCDWRNHTLMVCDLPDGKAKAIWKGHINGPSELLNPYQWVQSLPWSPDDREVLVATGSGRIVSVDIAEAGTQDLGPGFLPIGFTKDRELLVLKRKGPIHPPSWLVVRRNTQTMAEQAVVRITGPAELRAPLLSPDKDHISLAGMIYPGGEGTKGVHQYTCIIRLADLKHALLGAEVISWRRKPGTRRTQGDKG